MPTKNENDHSTQFKEPKRKKKRRLSILSLVFVVFLFYFFMTATSQNKMMGDLDKQIAQKAREKEIVAKKSDTLSKEVESIDDKDTLLKVVERLARNEYRMLKPNETIYIDKNKIKNKFIMGIGYSEDKIDFKDNDKDNDKEDDKDQD
jgi:cell division protein FtsB